MAAIDKIYGSNEQWHELHDWLVHENPKLIKYLYPPTGYKDGTDRPISNFSMEADLWLWDNCPLQFVLAGLSFQYNGHPHGDEYT